jgi:hypothetical protein
MDAIPLSQSSVRVWPADCATVQQSPPDFSWPEPSFDAQYQVSLTYPDGRTRRNGVAHNWINWVRRAHSGAGTARVVQAET